MVTMYTFPFNPPNYHADVSNMVDLCRYRLQKEQYKEICRRLMPVGKTLMAVILLP